MKKKKGRRGPPGPGRSGSSSDVEPRSPSPMAYPLEMRERAVREVVDHGASYADVGRLLGVGRTTVKNWVERYQAEGDQGLERRPAGAPSRPKKTGPLEEAVTTIRREHPEYGTRRIRDILERFAGLGLSEGTIRRILHEEGLIPETRERREKQQPEPVRFERAAPNQLWQSDIFTFLLRRQERVYVTAFLDDHSRFLVSHAIGHHQKSSLVMEALARGIAAYGVPEEILTDQGRQYTAWRGETEFAYELRRQGIHHIKSRPHHPQTLGKIERFWKTLWDEFLSKTVFADFADCVRRFELFIQAYNFHRPHQALGGLVPADRFFRAAPQVRAAIERTVEENARRLALEQPPRKPFYLVGRLGGRDLSISAAGSALRVQVGDEQPETIELPREDDDESQETPHRVRNTTPEEEETLEADAEVAEHVEGDRRNRATAMPDDIERAERRASRERRRRGGEDYEASLLSARGEGARRDARGGDSWSSGSRSREHDLERPHPRARGQGEAAREREAPTRAPLAFDEEGAPARTHEDARWEESEDDEPLRVFIDDEWEESFDELELEGVDDHPGWQPQGDNEFDPDEGWRGRALSWERKLTGRDAPRSNLGEKESEDVEESWDSEVRHRSRAVEGDRVQISQGARRAVRSNDGDAGREGARPRPTALSSPLEPSEAGDGRGDRAEAFRTSESPRARERAARGEGETGTRESAAARESGDGAAPPRRDDSDREARDTEQVEEEHLVDDEGREAREGGSRGSSDGGGDDHGA
jgi:transposase InsO family protein